MLVLSGAVLADGLVTRVDWRAVRVQTRSVLGGAYRGRDISERVRHSHLVAVDERGAELKVGCSGVELDHITDVCAFSDEELRARPTCPACAKKWDRRNVAAGEVVLP